MTDLEAVQGLEIQRLGIADLTVVLPPAGLAQPDTPLAELVAMPWVGTPPHCVLRRHLEALFASAGREYREGALANTDGAVRSMVASGFGAGPKAARYASPRATQATAVTVNGSEGTRRRQSSRSVVRLSASRLAR
jgi:DNA-binding transcriptional LysR family regulator